MQSPSGRLDDNELRLECDEDFKKVTNRTMLGAAAYDQNQILKSLRKVERGLRARLLSIAHDSCVALQIYQSLFPEDDIPIFANARAGSWYVPPSVRQRPTYTAAFKSADGHYGQWSSSLRRPNMHVLKAALDFGAVVLIDVTRRGKRFPDSFMKTVPIWCAVMNHIAGLYECHSCKAGTNLCDECGQIRVHPDVPESEKVQIHNRLPEWLKDWRRSIHALQSAVPVLKNIRRRNRPKPLHPIWINPESSLWESGIPLYELDFIPVVCISASKVVPEGERSFIEPCLYEQKVCEVIFPVRPVGSAYVQGAGDDEEAWCCGLSPHHFWSKFHRLMTASHGEGVLQSAMNTEERLEKEIANIVSETSNVSHASHRDNKDLPDLDIGTKIWSSRIILQKTSLEKLPALLNLASVQERYVIVLGASPHTVFKNDEEICSTGVDWMPLVDKKGKIDYKYAFGRALGPCLARLREFCVDRGKTVVAYTLDKKGDWCAGLAIAWLAWHCESARARQHHEELDLSEEGYSVSLPRKECVGFVDKETVHNTMLHFLSSFPEFELSRATLKQLNRFFSSPIPSSSLAHSVEEQCI
ncbi:unnamed protein product [Agarophyton chilense]